MLKVIYFQPNHFVLLLAQDQVVRVHFHVPRQEVSVPPHGSYAETIGHYAPQGHVQ